MKYLLLGFGYLFFTSLAPVTSTWVWLVLWEGASGGAAQSASMFISLFLAYARGLNPRPRAVPLDYKNVTTGVDLYY